MERSLRRLDEEDEKHDHETPDPQSLPVQRALFKARTVLIFGEIDMKLAERVTAQLLAFSTESEDDIRVVINSPGGHVESGDTIHDMIRYVGPKVKMIGTGVSTASSPRRPVSRSRALRPTPTGTSGWVPRRPRPTASSTRS